MQRQGRKGNGWLKFPGKQEMKLLSKLELRGLSYQKSSEAAGSQRRCRNNLPWTEKSFLFQEKSCFSFRTHSPPWEPRQTQTLGFGNSSQLPKKNPAAFPFPSAPLSWPPPSTSPFLNPNSSFPALPPLLVSSPCWDFCTSKSTIVT